MTGISQLLAEPTALNLFFLAVNIMIKPPKAVIKPVKRTNNCVGAKSSCVRIEINRARKPDIPVRGKDRPAGAVCNQVSALLIGAPDGRNVRRQTAIRPHRPIRQGWQ